LGEVRDGIERDTPMSYGVPEMVDLAQNAPIGRIWKVLPSDAR
jgi:hypothetical protein